jgi:putative ABC transport system ATP-binding protein
MPLVQLKNIKKSFRLGDEQLEILHGIDLTVEKGEFVAMMGPSGSGKSTTMNILGCLDKPTSGEYFLDGRNVADLDRDQLAAIRNSTIGFVFQGFNLLQKTSALENVELPMLYAGVPAKERHRRAKEALEHMGLGDRLHHEPNQLSGGQQQRVAIARGIVNHAPILMADEPTGNLDSKTSDEIMALFQRLNRDEGITIILVTHEPDVAAFAKRELLFRDGMILEDRVNEHPRS